MAENYQTEKKVPSVLFNHLVVEKVLEYLDILELKRFRQVCKFWNVISTPFLADKVETYLEGTKLEQFLEDIPSPTSSYAMCRNLNLKISSSQAFSKPMERLWPTIHLHIKELNLQITTLYAKRNLESLLLFHLPNITLMKLVIVKHWGIDEDTYDTTLKDPNRQCEREDITITIQPNLNLTHFHISNLGSLYGLDDGEEDDFRFPIKWNCFYKRFPQLQHIGCVGLNWMDIGEMLDAPSSALKSLEILDENIFPQTPNEDHLLQIAKLQNNLEALHLEVSPVVTTSLLTNLLKKHACLLKTLRLRRYPHPSYLPIEISNCSLNKVRFLEISEDLLSSLSFLPYMPLLERFHVIIRDYRHLNPCDMVYNTINPSGISHSGVKILYIEPPLISKDCIEKLSLCLPGLETLKVRVNNEMLTEICHQKQLLHWKCLQNLHITSWDGLTDEGITGIDDQILKFWSEFPSNTELQSYRNKPFIGNIVGLKSLTIEMWPDYDNHICDWSIFYGILEMKNLEQVTFIRCRGITSSVFSSISFPKKYLIH